LDLQGAAGAVVKLVRYNPSVFVMPLLRTLLLGTLLTLCTRAAADEYSKTASSSSSFIDEEAVFSAALHNE
jgi:hypothetical protein